jgi:chromosome partitioning protein
MIIAIANNKGGVGKSTIAVHLAAWLHKQGYKVILADCDAQQSSGVWIREAIPEIRAVRLHDPNQIMDELPVLNQEADFVIGDGPGSDTETSRSLLLHAHLAIMPCKASMLEVRAMAQVTQVLRQSQQVRNGRPPAIIVLSMVGRNYRLTQDMRKTAEALKLPIANTALILRQIYADAPGQADVVWNMGSRGREAATEIDQLFREILPEVAEGKVRRMKTHATEA